MLNDAQEYAIRLAAQKMNAGNRPVVYPPDIAYSTVMSLRQRNLMSISHIRPFKRFPRWQAYLTAEGKAYAREKGYLNADT